MSSSSINLLVLSLLWSAAFGQQNHTTKRQFKEKAKTTVSIRQTTKCVRGKLCNSTVSTAQESPTYASKEKEVGTEVLPSKQGMKSGIPSIFKNAMSTNSPPLQNVHRNVAKRSVTRQTTPSPLSTSVRPWGISGNLTMNNYFCAAESDEMSVSVQVLCHCDELCNLFQDCCEPLHSCGNNSVPQGQAIQKSALKDSIDCVLQSTAILNGIESEYFWMITSCPSNWLNSTERNLCENATETNDIDSLLPVSDPDSKLTYQNKFCATCHGSTNHLKWTPFFTCRLAWGDSTELYLNSSSFDDILIHIKSDPGCMLFFVPSPTVPGRQCVRNGESPVTSALWNTGRLCKRDADPIHKDMCSAGPLSLVYIKRGSHGAEMYARNIYCWLCLFSLGSPPIVRACSTPPSGKRTFAPVGFTMMLDPSKSFAKQCLPNTMSACSRENERCLSPALALLNVGYQLQMALTHNGSLEISGGMLDVCKVFSSYLNYIFHIAWVFGNEWVLQPRRTCSKPTVDQMKMAPYSNVVVIMHRIVVLQKQIRWYYDGVRMLETLKNSINDILHAKRATVPYNGVEFNVRVILNDTVSCASNDGSIKVEPPLPDKTARNSGNPRGYTRWMAFSVIWFTWPVSVYIIICEFVS